MYRQEVITALFNRVGFNKPTQAEYADLLDADNLLSKSGRYYDEFHGVVTVENIKEVVNNDVEISDADFNNELRKLKAGALKAVLDEIFNADDIIEQKLEFNRNDERPVLLD